MSGIVVEFVAPSAIAPGMRERMYQLMCRNYHGVSRDAFERDLDSKDFVMLGTDRGVPGGFTTARRFTVEVDGRSHDVLFSGDTIIDRPYRGCPVWAFRWLEHALTQARRAEAPLWWMLTSKGHLTYRLLPVWFGRFYPSAMGATPPRQRRLIDALGRWYAADRFDAAAGVVRGSGGQRLRAGVGDPVAKDRANVHTRFFLEANPGWAKGDELLCIAEIRRENLRPSVARRFAPSSP